ncbi:MAG: DUF2059 domain-containing protein [Microscillaceae bacterium]|nr:DUF2059 domain-containing protein [Microscillaceae bacterium]
MKKITCLFSIIVFLGTLPGLQAQSLDYRNKIKKMLELSGSEQMFKISVKQMLEQFKGMRPEIPAAFWNDFETEVMKTSINDLVEMLTPVYFHHLSESDLDELITFYESPIGKKFVSKNPMIMQESMQVGQEWGKKLGEQVVKKLEEKGYY